MNNYTFGKLILELREKKHLSQAELGKLLGVSNKVVSKWETGAFYPANELIYPLAKALGTTVEELYRAMSESKKEKTKLRRFLDFIFGFYKIEFVVLAALWLLQYVLFLLFGENSAKMGLLIAVPLVSGVLFGILYFMLWTMSKKPFVYSRYLDWIEIFFTCGMTIGTPSLIVGCILDPKNGFTVGGCLPLAALAAIILFHNRRKG